MLFAFAESSLRTMRNMQLKRFKKKKPEKRLSIKTNRALYGNNISSKRALMEWRRLPWMYAINTINKSAFGTNPFQHTGCQN